MNNQNSRSIESFEEAVCKNADLTFEEYQSVREEAVEVIVNDFAVKAIAKAKSEGREMTIEEARTLAKKEIPAIFVPEWMRNLRIQANVSGMELTKFGEILFELRAIRQIFETVYEKEILESIKNNLEKFKPKEGVEDGGNVD